MFDISKHYANIVKLLKKDVPFEAFFFLVIALLLSLMLGYGNVGTEELPTHTVSVVYKDRIEYVDRTVYEDKIVYVDQIEYIDRIEYVDKIEYVDRIEYVEKLIPIPCSGFWSHFTAPKPDTDPPLWYMGGNGEDAIGGTDSEPDEPGPGCGGWGGHHK